MLRLVRVAALIAATCTGIQGAHAWETWTKDGECFALLGMDPAAEVTVRPAARPYIAIKNAPKLDNHNGVVVVSGFGDDTGNEGTLDIDGQEFGLLIYNGAGFVRSGEPEQKVVAALEAGKEARVTWFRKDGLVIQVYKLDGFTTAKKTIDTACPRPGSAPAKVEKSSDTAPVKGKKR
ncbi:hypothetical protein [Bosea sp. RAC05]|uniref:hypothetical protein n=1 Tax=Bosea sp. RAC05 TaxID=1842539 RepID=UPI00085704B7|nr:hypothetical protein [Bosea sp. RAC05]AOG03100.1 hypothetical protein BSY19_5094 [Bosea sp. RAC05]